MTAVGSNLTSALSVSMLDASRAALERTRQSSAAPEARSPARENSAYWSIPTTLSASSLSLGSVQEANGVAAAVTDTAAAGLEEATDIVSRIQQKLIQAKALGANRPAIDAEIGTMKGKLAELVDDSSFNGQNWLKLEAGQRPKVASLIASLTSGERGELSINMIDVDTAQATLVSKEHADDGILTRSYAGTSMGGVPYDYYLMDVQSAVPNGARSREIRVDASTNSDELDGMISALNRVLIDMVGASAEVGAARSQISGEGDFLEGLAGASDLSSESRVRADLGEADARRAAEQARTELQGSALNIANASMGGWLKIYL
ncbi:flagellar hook associated protein [Rhizobium wuzhouense]|uniref:Flagellar hook associated protein n=1 Tax=Rhizobium wuzhouense TaxID=1986026 RepID=A0ABX5NWG7_9HYPH|nr:flagellar hook associated protein [Rhizobium wuzhouense]PYB75543.1 flagellar hook associated protein [Rhizobium wuzhouense]